MAGEFGEGFFGRLEDMFSYLKKLEELAEFMEKLGKPKDISELESRLYDFFKKSSRNNLTEAMEKVNTALGGMENVVLEDKEHDFSKDSLFYEAFSKAMKENSIYEKAFLIWAITKSRETADSLFKRKIILSFYESTPGDNAMNCMIIGSTEKPRLKVFSKEAGDFCIQTFEWPHLKIAEFDRQDFAARRYENQSLSLAGFIEIQNPNITESKREPWKNDSKGLLGMIDRESKEYSVMLANSSGNIPYEQKAIAITSAFIEAFKDYHKKKKEEKKE